MQLLSKKCGALTLVEKIDELEVEIARLNAVLTAKEI
jgi:hypothetical protein